MRKRCTRLHAQADKNKWQKARIKAALEVRDGVLSAFRPDCKYGGN
jgi:hypothetical protein